MKFEEYDVVVIGGGAAGLSAALVLGRARRRVAVVDAGQPRNAPAAHMHGFLSRDGTPPKDLLAMGRAEATGYGVESIQDRVVGVQRGFGVELFVVGPRFQVIMSAGGGSAAAIAINSDLVREDIERAVERSIAPSAQAGAI